MVEFDFGALEARWIATVDKVLAPLAKRKETFYALAFHNGYAERGRVISAPSLAINSIEALAAADDEDLRWSPADWVEPEISAPKAIGTIYKKLTAAATALETDKGWERVHAAYVRTMFGIAKTLGARARKGEGVFAKLSLAPDFIVCVMDDDHGLDGVKRSVPAARFARLFPEHGPAKRARKEVIAKPPPDRAGALVAGFADKDAPVGREDATKQLVKLGAKAVPALIEGLAHPEVGWMAATTLHAMGPPDAVLAVPALLQAVRKQTNAAMWAASALGRLGRLEELNGFLRDPKTASNAIGGLAKGRPASYPYLEAVLDRGDRKLTARIADELRPGTPAPDPSPSGLDAIVKATTSKHEILRKDATLALGKASLGEKNRARAVPLLIALLGDKASEVRRLAALSLERCGRRHAKSAVPELHRIAKTDRVANVRATAASALRKLA